MKLGLKSRLYNAEIRNRRMDLGLSQAELARRIGMCRTSVSRAERLGIVSPKALIIQALAAYFGVDALVLCPEWLPVLQGKPMTLDRQEDVTASMIAGAHRRAALPLAVPPSQEEDTDMHFLAEDVERALATLDDREAAVLRLRYGIPDGPQHTLQEISDKVGVSSERVRQISSRAIKKLGLPHRAGLLDGHLRLPNESQRD